MYEFPRVGPYKGVARLIATPMLNHDFEILNIRGDTLEVRNVMTGIGIKFTSNDEQNSNGMGRRSPR